MLAPLDEAFAPHGEALAPLVGGAPTGIDGSEGYVTWTMIAEEG